MSRLTVSDHARFRSTGRNPFEGDEDLADELLADPRRDRPMQTRNAAATSRVLGLLDELAEQERDRGKGREH